MASPEPQGIVELATIKILLADGAVVICAGGGGIPVRRTPTASSGASKRSSTRTRRPRSWPRASEPTPFSS